MAFRRTCAIAVTLAVVFFASQVHDLARYPLVGEDESLLNEPARTLAASGTFDSPLLSADHTPAPLVLQPPVQAVVMAGVYAVAGYGLWPTRLASLTWSAMALLMVGLLGTRLGGDDRVGIVAALLLASHPHFAVTARLGRADTLCMAFLSLAAYAYLDAAERRSARAAFLAGVSIALACATHLVATGPLLGLTVLMAGIRSRRLFARFLAGGAVTALAWVLVAWQVGPSYVEQLLWHVRLRSAAPGLIPAVAAEGGRWLALAGRAPFLLAAYLLAIGHAAVEWRQTPRAIRNIWVLVGMSAAFNTVLMSKTTGYYPMYVGLWLSLAAAAWAVDAWDRSRQSRRLAGVVVAIAIASSLAIDTLPRVFASTVQRQARSYEPVARRLESVVLPGARVWTVPETWYALARDGRSVRIPALGFNPVPDARTDDFAVLGPATPVPAGFHLITRIGEPIPPVAGRTFASSSYEWAIYASNVRGPAPMTHP